GGGPAIEKMLTQLNIAYTFIDGLRKTTDEMMNVVEMVLTGNVNPTLTRKFNACGMRAAGLSGSDSNLLEAEAIDKEKYGQVGKIKQVNTEIIQHLLDHDVVPVISPVAIDATQMRLNVNADTA